MSAHKWNARKVDVSCETDCIQTEREKERERKRERERERERERQRDTETTQHKAAQKKTTDAQQIASINLNSHTKK